LSKDRWRSLPNALGVLRLALIPVFVVLVLNGFRTAAFLTLAVSGVTDLLDGFLARRLGVTSRGGAILDAVADKLTQVAGLAVLTWPVASGFTRLPVWLLGAVLVRDLVLVAGWSLLRARKVVEVEHALHGRATTVLMYAVLLAATAGLPAAVVHPGAALAAAGALLSAAGYARRAHGGPSVA
jgi:cardiolipin synthase (CMP-forming)